MNLHTKKKIDAQDEIKEVLAAVDRQDVDGWEFLKALEIKTGSAFWQWLFQGLLK